MPTRVLLPRLHLVALLAAWFWWTLAAGAALFVPVRQTIDVGVTHFYQWTVPGDLVVISLGLLVFVSPQLVELARRASLWPVRVVGVASLVGLLGLWLGLDAGSRGEFVALADWQWRDLAGVVVLVLVALARRPARDLSPAASFFLLDRTHASNAVARRALIVAGGHALLVVVAIGLALRSPAHALWRAGLAYLVGVLLSLYQRYPQRSTGLLPLAGLISSIGLLAAWIAPESEWPLLLLGAALGLGHIPSRNDLLASLPPNQRIVGLAIMVVSQILGALVGAGLIHLAASDSTMHALAFAVALCLTAAAGYTYRREVFETLIEPMLAILYPIRGYGPGLKILPTRGPLLVVANHCAWFDPLWVAKVIPLRLRPMMTSRFYDLPVISWLMRNVFRTIRVPDAAFRREAPEIHEAIAALDCGESVLIFPEGWLKRREEQSVRRFGQGIYQILREKPRTPVVACWIEGGWGSYTSFWNGPPTKNKKLDLFRHIRIAISEPEVLSLEVLSDPIQTRRHVMQACLRARTYLGLPELPAPRFGADSDAEDERA